MKTNELIYKEIAESGHITESNMKLLKNRSNKNGHDLFDYDFLESFADGCGIPLTAEQGEKGLLWLKKFIRKDGSSNVYGYREIEIVQNATPSDFLFHGFYDAGNYLSHYYLPIYSVNGMQYVAKKEPYIVG